MVEATEQSLAYTKANDDREDEPNLERPVKTLSALNGKVECYMMVTHITANMNANSSATWAA